MAINNLQSRVPCGCVSTCTRRLGFQARFSILEIYLVNDEWFEVEIWEVHSRVCLHICFQEKCTEGCYVDSAKTNDDGRTLKLVCFQ